MANITASDVKNLREMHRLRHDGLQERLSSQADGDRDEAVEDPP